MGRRNVKGTKFNKESYSYYNKLYNANKSYYKKMGYNELIPIKMDKEAWNYKKSATGMSNKDIVFEEFHKYNREQTESLIKKFKSEGIKANRAKIARGQFTANQWNSIKETYVQLKDDGMSASEAGKMIAYMFWGSP